MGFYNPAAQAAVLFWFTGLTETCRDTRRTTFLLLKTHLSLRCGQKIALIKNAHMVSPSILILLLSLVDMQSFDLTTWLTFWNDQNYWQESHKCCSQHAQYQDPDNVTFIIIIIILYFIYYFILFIIIIIYLG